uniref:Uncharacterized protein n=1 Tax=Aegilops tauschii subsp. strangulata TaxID=200361 RepID=A0A453QD06_AEGTS
MDDQSFRLLQLPASQLELMLLLRPASIRRQDSCMAASRTPTRPVLPPVCCCSSCRLHALADSVHREKKNQ